MPTKTKTIKTPEDAKKVAQKITDRNNAAPLMLLVMAQIIKAGEDLNEASGVIFGDEKLSEPDATMGELFSVMVKKQLSQLAISMEGVGRARMLQAAIEKVVAAVEILEAIADLVIDNKEIDGRKLIGTIAGEFDRDAVILDVVMARCGIGKPAVADVIQNMRLSSLGRVHKELEKVREDHPGALEIINAFYEKTKQDDPRPTKMPDPIIRTAKEEDGNGALSDSRN
jgi:hypothetical protein